MSLVSSIRGRRGESGFGYASTAEEVTAGFDLRGRTVLITGVNSGLGQESARVLSLRGARVIAAARTIEKAREACRGLVSEAIPIACELSEPSSVRICVAEVVALGVPLDSVICNAAIMALPKRELKYGQELQFLTNHVGHFMLVTGLLGALSESGRVVMVSSAAHKRAPRAGIQFDDLTLASNYKPWAAYGQSKLANLLFARSLARRFHGTQRTANALHPGVISTNLGRHMGVLADIGYPIASAIAMKSIAEGAATQCYVATHPALATVSGKYFADCNIKECSRHAQDDAMGDRLWEVSEEIVRRL
jgi:NAD(P)-dependent dehydrogenase (short-subunit alcohol dehydrogenase family)